MIIRCLILISVLLSHSFSAAEAQDEALFNGADTVQFSVEIKGKFNHQASWDVNLVNATWSSFEAKPEDMDIPQETLDLLNAEIKTVFENVLEQYQIKHVSRNKKDYKKYRERAEPIFTKDGDRYYRIEMIIAGDNGVGGHYGGLDIQLFFKSLHRSTNVVYGYSFRTLKIGSTKEETLRELKLTLTDQLRESYEDWKESLQKDLKSPRCYLLLHFDVKELSRKQQKFVGKQLFSCLYSRADSLGYINLKKFYYQIFYRLDTDQGETEESHITHYAELLQFSMGSSDKYPCSLRKTPLENYRTTATIDSVQKLITIGWRKPD